MSSESSSSSAAAAEEEDSSSSTLGAFLWKLTAVVFTVLNLLTIGLGIGEYREQTLWSQLPSTLSFYATDDNCYDTATTQNGDDQRHILNCGSCGACSNRHDIRIYRETAQTLTRSATLCAMRGFVGGRSETRKCFQESVNLTDACTDCWIKNVECNFRTCLVTCLKHRVFTQLPSLVSWEEPLQQRQQQNLDPCHACDEAFCGPEFVTCAGANRRRVGIVSDIERDMGREFCRRVDWDWIMLDDNDEEENKAKEGGGEKEEEKEVQKETDEL